MAECDREGTFRGIITAPGLVKGKSPSKSVGVTFTAKLQEMWIEGDEGGHWEPWSQYGQEAEGTSWIVGKNGTPNEKAVESLVSCAGWSGNLAEIYEGAWEPTPCQFVVQESTYKDVTSYKVAFINDYNRVPGGNGNMEVSEAKLLAAELGAQFRAIAANAKRTPAPTGTKPASPPKFKAPVNSPTSVEDIKNGDTPF